MGFAVASGLLLVFSFPKFGHPILAWIALVPLFVALSGWSGRADRVSGVRPLRALHLGLVTGVIYFTGTLYWTGQVIQTFGGIPAPVAMVGVLLLGVYQGAFPALAAVCISRFFSRLGVLGFTLAPAAWVATEYCRGTVFGGFPWVLLGSSQVTNTPVIQLASVLGVYGVSGLVAAINTAIAAAMVSSGARRAVAVTAGVVLFTGVAGWGALRVADGALTRTGTPVRVGLVQGNIAQQDKWRADEAPRILDTYLSLTRLAVRDGAQFVLWPESATPTMFEADPQVGMAVRNLARDVRVPLLFGSDQEENDGDGPRLYNAAFMLGPAGNTTGVYRKINLVPWGEFIPLKRYLYFVSPLVDSLTDFSPGTSIVLLPVGSHLVSTAICYEVVFPGLIRQAVNAGSELLTTITNDAWYGQSSAPFQHFALASVRAVEEGRYLARAANTGISGVVDPYGRIVRQTAIFEQSSVVEEVRLLTGKTIYARIGDVVAYASLVLVGLGLLAPRR
jgi:apolipoprotein N-acyltransferase